MKRSGRSVEAASRVIEIEEELVATMVSGFSAAHSSEKTLRLTSSFSVAVSMTMSQLASASYFSAVVMRAELHRGVDRLDVPDALIERVDRLVDHRQQDAVDDEGREIFRNRDRLVEGADELLGGFERLVVGRDAANDLHQLHQRHRIHEMNADEAFGPVGRSGKPRDRDR